MSWEQGPRRSRELNVPSLTSPNPQGPPLGCTVGWGTGTSAGWSLLGWRNIWIPDRLGPAGSWSPGWGLAGRAASPSFWKALIPSHTWGRPGQGVRDPRAGQSQLYGSDPAVLHRGASWGWAGLLVAQPRSVGVGILILSPEAWSAREHHYSKDEQTELVTDCPGPNSTICTEALVLQKSVTLLLPDENSGQGNKTVCKFTTQTAKPQGLPCLHSSAEPSAKACLMVGLTDSPPWLGH
jgi:hypothetical protein